jgi:hypothetical protein
MLSKNLAGKSLPELQKALMGGDPSIEPYQALAAIEKMVKSEKAKTAQMAQQQPPQGMVAQRKLAEAAALRNPYMAAGLGAAPVASPVTAPMGEAPQEAPVGMAGGGMVAFAKGGGVSPYESGFEALSDDERIAALQKYKESLGANNAELLAPLEAQQAKYAQEAEKTKKGGLSDALIAAGLGMMSGKSQYAMQNIGEGGLKGLEAYQNAQKAGQAAQDKMLQSQADMAKSRIALEKGDETTAAALQNQARQEAQAAGQFKLQGQYYAGSNAAQMAAAQARAAAADGGGWKEDVARQKLQLAREALMAKDMGYRLARTALATAKNDKDRATAEANIAAIERQHGIGTMPTAAPNMPPVGGDLPSLDSFYKK